MYECQATMHELLWYHLVATLVSTNTITLLGCTNELISWLINDQPFTSPL